MAFVTTNYQLASENDNAGGLTAVTSITDGTNVFAEPQGLFDITRGESVIQSNGVAGFRGYPSLTWISNMTVKQYWYLVDNYEGLVTIKTAYGGLTWANYNAVLTLPDPAQMTRTVFLASSHAAAFVGPGFLNVRWAFTRLEAL